MADFLGKVSNTRDVIRRVATVFAVAWLSLSFADLAIGLHMPTSLLVAGKLGLALRLLLYLADVVEGLRTQRLREAALSAVPEVVKRLIRGELDVYRFFIESLLRRPSAPIGHSFREAPKYRTLLALLAFSAVLEAPLFFVIIRYAVPTNARLLMDLVATSGAIYFIIVIRADWFALASSTHALRDDYLELHLGFRFRGRVKLAQVLEVEELKYQRATVISLHKHLLIRLTPIDQPNVLVSLKERGVIGQHWRRGTVEGTSIALYVDEPAAFVRDLSRAISSDNSSTFRAF